MVVGQDEAGLVDDEAGAGGLRPTRSRGSRGWACLALALPLPWPRPWRRARLAEEALEQVVAAASAAEEVAEVLRAAAATRSGC